MPADIVRRMIGLCGCGQRTSLKFSFMTFMQFVYAYNALIVRQLRRDKDCIKVIKENFNDIL